MDIDNYTTDEIKQELAQAKRAKVYYEQQDKRLKSVKRELFWNKMLITRAEAELKRRGIK